jgi:hypothetical protein
VRSTQFRRSTRNFGNRNLIVKIFSATWCGEREEMRARPRDSGTSAPPRSLRTVRQHGCKVMTLAALRCEGRGGAALTWTRFRPSAVGATTPPIACRSAGEGGGRARREGEVLGFRVNPKPLTLNPKP